MRFAVKRMSPRFRMSKVSIVRESFTASDQSAAFSSSICSIIITVSGVMLCRALRYCCFASSDFVFMIMMGIPRNLFFMRNICLSSWLLRFCSS